jgi:hypothetical protein
MKIFFLLAGTEGRPYFLVLNTIQLISCKEDSLPAIWSWRPPGYMALKTIFLLSLLNSHRTLRLETKSFLSGQECISPWPWTEDTSQTKLKVQKKTSRVRLSLPAGRNQADFFFHVHEGLSFKKINKPTFNSLYWTKVAKFIQRITLNTYKVDKNVTHKYVKGTVPETTGRKFRDFPILAVLSWQNRRPGV